jgi:hypothetical protein
LAFVARVQEVNKMATIKKYNDGTMFYDAFGGKIGETTVEEEWMGDSFNRDSSICAYKVNQDSCIDTLNELTGYVTASASNYGLASHADGYATVAKGVDGTRDQKIVVNDIAFDTTTHSLKAELRELKAQIDALKKSMTTTSKLRPALKTLQYKSEVE